MDACGDTTCQKPFFFLIVSKETGTTKGTAGELHIERLLTGQKGGCVDGYSRYFCTHHEERRTKRKRARARHPEQPPQQGRPSRSRDSHKTDSKRGDQSRSGGVEVISRSRDRMCKRRLPVSPAEVV